MKMCFCWNTAFCMLLYFVFYLSCVIFLPQYAKHINVKIWFRLFLTKYSFKDKIITCVCDPVRHVSVTGRCDWCLGGACCCIVRPHAPVTLHGPRGHLLTRPHAQTRVCATASPA